jgi:hypothetical protein
MWKRGFWGKVFSGIQEHRYRSRRASRALTKAIFEILEPRIMLTGTTFHVSSLLDNGNPNALRAAIQSAVTDTTANNTSDTIVFDASGTVTLSGSALQINNTHGSITISATPGSVVIDGHGQIQDFSISSASTTINGLTIRGGHAAAGGGIGNFGQLVLSNCTLTGNTAGQGGAIYNYNGRGTLSISDCVISGNSATSGAGGLSNGMVATVTRTVFDQDNGYAAILNTDGSQSLNISDSKVTGSNGDGIYNSGNYAFLGATDCVISGNTGAGIHDAYYTFNHITDCTISNNHHSGIENETGALTVVGSTISGNTNSGGLGGGIASYYIDPQYTPAQTVVFITNCTITGNSAQRGGGISSAKRILDSTIYGNIATNTNGVGGVIFADSIDGSIIAGNVQGDVTSNDVFSGSYDLIGDGSGLWERSSHNIILGSASNPINPLLAPLGYYGGPTETMPLLPGSRALGAGSTFTDQNNNPIATDQRGLPRSSTIDIGAFQTQGSLSLVVNTNQDDAASGGVGAGLLSLRDAINLADVLANATHSTETIAFDSGVTGTIALNGSALVINNTVGKVTIDGPGAGPLTINALGHSQVFTTGLGATEIDDLTITGGSSSGYGGGIGGSLGTLTVRACTITGNTAIYGGGGIYSDGATSIINSTISANHAEKGAGVYLYYFWLDQGQSPNTISQCTITGNIASLNSGGVYNSKATTTITDSTISGNSANNGGGLFNYYGTLTIVDSTITGNSASVRGGGIYNDNYLTVTDCTLSGNSASNGGGGGIAGGGTLNGTIVANSGTHGGDLSSSNFFGTKNLIDDTTASSTEGLSPSNNTLDVSANLAALGWYGGPTQTMALLPGSPALDKGYSGTGAPTTDERGVARSQGAAPDIGAFESKGFTIIPAGGTNQSAGLGSPFASDLRAAITANDSNLTNLAGGVITFTAPATGASAVLSASHVTLTSSNIADVTATANNSVGSYVVTASAGTTAGTPGQFALRNINDTTPTVSIGAVPVAIEGSPVTLTASGTPGNAGDSLAYLWNIFKDGQPFALSSNDGASLSFTPDDSGTWSAMVTVTDLSSGLSASASTSPFHVANVAPQISATGDPSVLVGSPYTLNIAGTYVGDPDGDAITGWWIDWGDGTPVQQAPVGTTSLQHTYQAVSTASIVVTATDADGAYSSSPLVIQVLSSGSAVSPVTPALSAAPVSSSEIDLTYSVPANSTPELEWLAPGDLNFHALTKFKVISSTSSSTTVAITGLAADTHYNFELNVIQNAQVSNSLSAFARTNDATGDSLATPVLQVNGPLQIFWNPQNDPAAEANGFTIREVIYQNPTQDPLALNPINTDPYTSGTYTVSPGNFTPNNLYYLSGEIPTNGGLVDLQIDDGVNKSQWIAIPSDGVGAPPDVAPSNVQVIIDSVNHSIHLAWHGDDIFEGPPTGLQGFFFVYGITNNNSVDQLGPELVFSDPNGTGNFSTTFDNSVIPNGVQEIFVVSAYQPPWWEDSFYSQLVPIVDSSAIATPTAPKTLSAVETFNTDGSAVVNLAWEDDSNNETGYIVERKDITTGSDWGVITATPLDADTIVYQDQLSSSAAADNYEYRVRAVNNGGNSSPSPVAAITTGVSPPQDVFAQVAGGTAIRTVWNNTAPNATGFLILESVNGGSFSYLATVGGTVSSYIATGLQTSTNYTFEVVALDGSVQSTAVATNSITTGPADTSGWYQVSGVTGDIANGLIPIHHGIAAYSATSPGMVIADGNWIWAAGWQAAVYEALTGSATVNGLTYDFASNRFFAADASQPGAGSSEGSLSDNSLGLSPTDEVIAFEDGDDFDYNDDYFQVSVTEKSGPAAPVLSATAISQSQVNLSWIDTDSSITGYTLERSSGGGNFSVIANLPATANSFPDSGLALNTNYTYLLIANNVVGSATSNPATARTLLLAAAPSNLIAQTISSDTVDLRWSDNSTNETRFQVEASLNGGSYSIIGNATTDVTHFLATGLQHGAKYTFRVAAFDSDGLGPYSPLAVASTVPDPISGLTATLTSNSDTSVQLHWTASTDLNVDQISIEYRSNLDANYTLANPAAGTATSATIIGLKPNTLYYFQVRALTFPGAFSGTNYLGNAVSANYSAYSNLTSTQTQNQLPTSPSQVTLAASTTPGELTISWTNDATYQDGYIVSLSSDGGNTFDTLSTIQSPTASNLTIEGYDPKVAYIASVSAYNPLGTSTPRESAAVHPAPVGTVGTPTLTVVSNYHISLSWTFTPSTSASYPLSYILQRRTGAEPFATITKLFGTSGAGGGSYDDTSLAAGTEYDYRIQAVYGNSVYSDYSGSNTATTTAYLPVAITDFTATDSSAAGQAVVHVTLPDDPNRQAVLAQVWTDGGQVITTPVVLSSNNAGTVTGLIDHLEPNTTYNLTVFAFNSVGDQSTIPNNQIVTTHNLLVPTAPTASEPAAPNFPNANTNESILLTWSYTPPTGTAWPDAFIIQQKSSTDTDFHNSKPNNVSVNTSGQEQALITNLQPGVSYQFRVIASFGWPVASISGTTVGVGGGEYLTAPSPASNTCATTDLAPTTPANLTASPTSPTSGQMSWLNTSPLTDGFHVQISADNGATYISLPDVQGSNLPTQFGAVAGNLLPSTPYLVRVSAFNSVGSSAWTSPQGFTTPAAPVDTAPDPTVLSLVGVPNSGEIDLAWTTSARATGYRVEISSDDTTFNALTETKNTTYQATHLIAGTTYYFRVFANDDAGDSPSSNIVNATTPPYAIPFNLTATALTTTQIDLAWSEGTMDDTGFIVEESTDGLNFAAINGTSVQFPTTPENMRAYLVQGLTPGKTYYFRVRAVGPQGAFSSQTSNVASNTTTPVTIPATPVIMDPIVLSNSEIEIKWNDNADNEDNYMVLLNWQGGLDIPDVTLAANTNDFIISGLQGDTLYEMRVRATNYAGSSVVSEEVSATTMPDPPSGLTATADSPNSVALSWNQVYNAQGYTIQSSLDGRTWTTITPSLVTNTTYEVTNVTANDQYRISVTMPDGVSPYSAPATITQPAASDLAVTSAGDDEIDLAWTPVPSASGYELERSIGNSGVWTTLTAPTSTSYADTGLTPGTQYSYRIRVLNSMGASAYTTVTQTTSIPAPDNFNVSIAANGATFTWVNTSNAASSYAIQQLDQNGNWQTIATAGAGATEILAAGTYLPSTGYSFQIVSQSSIASGDASPELDVVSPAFAAAPASLTISNVSYTSLTLTWTAGSTETGDFFLLERSTDNRNWTAIDGPETGSLTFNDTGLAEAKQYYYRVSAINTAGPSDYAAASTTTLVPTPTAFAVTSASSTAITLSWQDSASGVSYSLLYSLTGLANDYHTLPTASTTATSITEPGAYPPSTPYYFEIQASSGAQSSAFSTITYTTANYPAQPAAPAIANVGFTGISVNWTAVGNTNDYIVQRNTNSSGFWQTIGTVDASRTSFFDATTAPVTTYSYRIIAANPAGQSVPGTASASLVTPIHPPSAITIASVSGHETDLSWVLPPEPLTAFKIYRSQTAGVQGNLLTTLGPTATSYVDAGPFDPNTPYYYQVVAVNGAATAAGLVQVTTGNFPATPQNLVVSQDTSEYVLDLTWTAASGAIQYIVYRRSPNLAWTVVGTPTTNSFTDTTVSPGNNYQYEILATNAAGESGYSTVQTQYPTFVDPTSPDTLTSTIENLNDSNAPQTPNQLYLSWTSHSTDELGFEIQMASFTATGWDETLFQDITSSDPALQAIRATVGAGVTSYVVTGLQPGTTYFFRVRAIRPHGPSDWSNESYGITLVPAGGQPAQPYTSSPGMPGGAPQPGLDQYLHEYFLQVNGINTYTFDPGGANGIEGTITFSDGPVWATSMEDAVKKSVISSTIVQSFTDGSPSIPIPWFDANFFRFDDLSETIYPNDVALSNGGVQNGANNSGDSDDPDGNSGQWHYYVSYRDSTIHPCINGKITPIETKGPPENHSKYTPPQTYTPAMLSGITATDDANQSNSVTSPDNGNPAELAIALASNGIANVDVSGAVQAASDGDKDDALWNIITNNPGSSNNNIVVANGTVSGNQTIELNSSKYGYSFTLQGGIDSDGDDQLQENEVSYKINIDLLKLSIESLSILQDNPTITTFKGITPQADGKLVVYGGSEAATSDKLTLVAHVTSNVHVDSYTWSISNGSIVANAPPTNSQSSQYAAGAVHADPGTYTFTVHAHVGGLDLVQSQQIEIGVRTDDAIVVGWIDPSNVTVNPAGVNPALTAYFPPAGPAGMTLTQTAGAVFVLGQLVDWIDNANNPDYQFVLNPPQFNGFAPTLADRTYLMTWLFKYAANTDPVKNLPTGNLADPVFGGIDLISVAQFAGHPTYYKLFNDLQIRYRVGANGFNGTPVILRHGEDVGTTVDPLTGSLFPGQEGPASTPNPFMNNVRVSNIVDGSPDVRGIDAFNALMDIGTGAPGGLWENIGDRIAFNYNGVNGSYTTPQIIAQNYPTYYVFLNGLLQPGMTQTQNPSPTGHFYPDPYPWGGFNNGVEPSSANNSARIPPFSVP